MRSLVVLLLLAGVASAKPAWRPPPPPRTDTAELAARLAEAIRNRDTGAVTSLLATPMQFDGLWFADAACAKRFGKQGVLEEKESVRTLAKCLAQQKLIATTRRSSLGGGAILTFEPGVELEVVFKNDRVAYAASLWPRAADRGTPTLTVQAFEALRTAGTTQLDAALATKLTAPASVWIKVCLDKTGAISDTFFAEAKPAAAADAFRAAIADWKFKPFAKGPACAMTLLSYPATSAPAVEVVPAPPGTVSANPYALEDDLVDLLDFNGVSVSGAPLSVPQSILEAQRLRGTRTIEPDATTKAAIARSATGSVNASFKLCLDSGGKITSVSPIKSTGFRDYDRKIEVTMRTWAFKPYRSTAVCATYSFNFRAKP